MGLCQKGKRVGVGRPRQRSPDEILLPGLRRRGQFKPCRHTGPRRRANSANQILLRRRSGEAPLFLRLRRRASSATAGLGDPTAARRNPTRNRTFVQGQMAAQHGQLSLSPLLEPGPGGDRPGSLSGRPPAGGGVDGDQACTVVQHSVTRQGCPLSHDKRASSVSCA